MVKISIIIPVYNTEKYLNQCIDSILNQSYKNFEVILVDDGSTDGSPEICDAYLKSDSRVRVAHKKNGGQASARNHGISMANGEYMMFIDSDDFLCDLDSLEKIEEKTNTNPDIVMYGLKRNSHTNNTVDFLVNTFLSLPTCICTGEEYLMEMLSKNSYYPWGPCNSAINAKYWQAKKFSFAEGVFYEDLLLMWRVILNAKTFALIPEIFYIYRMDQETSTTKRYSRKIMNDHLYVLEQNAKDLENIENVDSKIKDKIKETFANDYYDLILKIFANYDEGNDNMYNHAESLFTVFKDDVRIKKYKYINKWIECFGFNKGMRVLGFMKKSFNSIEKIWK